MLVGNFGQQDVQFFLILKISVEPKLSYHLHSDRSVRNFGVNGQQPLCHERKNTSHYLNNIIKSRLLDIRARALSPSVCTRLTLALEAKKD